MNQAPFPVDVPAAAAAPPRCRPRAGVWFSGITILLGVMALMLALLPRIIYDEPFRWPWDPEEEKKAAGAAEFKGDLTIRTKRFRFSVGTNTPTQPTVAAEPPPPPSPTKPYRMAMIIVCALGLGMAPLAWVRERHRPLAGTGAALCCAALFWQYLVIGIVVGVVIAVVLLLMSMLG